MKVVGGETTCQSEGGNLKSTIVGAFQLKIFGTMSLPMALCLECQASVARVASRWCSTIAMRRWSRCTECTEAELEVQRSIKRGELTAFLCLRRKATGLTMVHVDNKGIIDGLWRGEKEVHGLRATDADL